MQGHFGLSPAAFAATFGIMVLGFILGTVMAQKVVASKGSLRAIEVGVVLQAMAGLALLGFSLATRIGCRGSQCDGLLRDGRGFHAAAICCRRADALPRKGRKRLLDCWASRR